MQRFHKAIFSFRNSVTYLPENPVGHTRIRLKCIAHQIIKKGTGIAGAPVYYFKNKIYLVPEENTADGPVGLSCSPLLPSRIADSTASVVLFLILVIFFSRIYSSGHSKTPMPDAKNISFVSCIFARCNYVHIQ